MKFKTFIRKQILKSPTFAIMWFEHKLWVWLTKRKIKKDGRADVKEWIDDLYTVLKNNKHQ